LECIINHKSEPDNASIRLKLTAAKTELIWFDFDRKLSRENDCPSTIMNIEANSLITPSKVVRNQDVLFDYQLTVVNHILSSTRACYFHLRRISQVRRCLSVQALTPRLYGNLFWQVFHSKLQRMTSVRSSCRSVHVSSKYFKPHDHITPSSLALIRARIIHFKVCLLVYNVYSGTSPHCISFIYSIE